MGDKNSYKETSRFRREVRSLEKKLPIYEAAIEMYGKLTAEIEQNDFEMAKLEMKNTLILEQARVAYRCANKNRTSRIELKEAWAKVAEHEGTAPKNRRKGDIHE